MTTLIATVGSNPLPVVVSICALNPDRLWLLYTDDVEGVTNRISNHLNRELPKCEISQLEIKDHQKAKSILATLGKMVLRGFLWRLGRFGYYSQNSSILIHYKSMILL